MMPWQLSYSASADLENSELQTDVMRFMAILAFCLVAIFAIVQSMPLQQQRDEPVAEAQEQSPAKPLTRVVERVAQPVTEPAAAPKPAPVPKPIIRAAAKPKTLPVPPRQVPATRPAAKPAAATVPSPRPEPVATAPSPRGVSLRFESDAVLRGLVERNLVGLYAISGDRFFAMQVAGSRIAFGDNTAPSQFHQMIYETVPAEVTATFTAQHGLAASNVTWGVTLPPATTAQLRRFVQTNYDGGLVITAEATLALAGDG